MAEGDIVLVMPETIEYGKDLQVRDSIETDCEFTTQLSDNILKHARKEYSTITTEKPASGEYHVLNISVTGIVAHGGGGWSGSKFAQISGTLVDQDGKELGSFDIHRTSMGGFSGAFKGTCGFLKRITKTLGQDMGKFLANPSEHFQG